MKILKVTLLLTIFFTNISYSQQHNHNVNQEEVDILTTKIQNMTRDEYITYLKENNPNFDLSDNKINDKVNDIDVVNNFFNIFKGARLYYNNRGFDKKILCDKPSVLNTCDSIFFPNKSADFFIIDTIIENNKVFYQLKINNQTFYTDAFNLIKSFNFDNFYEIPLYYSDNLMDQSDKYINGLKKLKIEFTFNESIKYYNCGGELRLFYCNNNNNHLKNGNYLIEVVNFNKEKMAVFIRIPEIRQELSIPFSLFYNLIQQGNIQKKSF